MKEIILPSGKKAVIREGKGRDLIAANRAAKTESEVNLALIAQLSEIDGKQVVLEDLLEMGLRDLTVLSSEVLADFLSPQNQSSTSALSQDGASETLKK